VRVYLPPDANTPLSAADHGLRSRNHAYAIVARDVIPRARMPSPPISQRQVHGNRLTIRGYLVTYEPEGPALGRPCRPSHMWPGYERSGVSLERGVELFNAGLYWEAHEA
jgi:hypothetical protein